MKSSMLRGLLVLSLPLLAARADAADWYVDVQNGSNANDGSMPATAWRNVSHAVATIAAAPLEPHTIHVAPGHYLPSTGEAFPLTMRPGLRIAGSGAVLDTILEAGTGPVVVFASEVSGNGYAFDEGSGLERLTLQNSGTGVAISTNWNPVSPSFRDLRITGMSGWGVTVSTFGFGGHTAHPTFERATIDDCDLGGIDLSASGSSSSSFGNTLLDLADSVVRDNGGNGIFLRAPHGTTKASLVRTRIEGNAGAGVAASAGTNMSTLLDARSSLIRTNGNGGVRGFNAIFLPELYGCTIAGNSGPGVEATVATSSPKQLVGCVLFGNLDDVWVQNLSAQNSSSGDADLLGQPGCIQADPLFVNVATGDYRLRFGSPCVDSGDPSTNGEQDLLGNVRRLDGDLDTLGAPDMGAFEFEPLHRIGTPSLGKQFGFEFWGAAGSASTLYLARSPLTPAQATPFGDLFLDPALTIELGTVPAQPGPAFVLRRVMPSNPVLVGTTFSFQALTDSALAPQGRAWTNPTSFVVEP